MARRARNARGELLEHAFQTRVIGLAVFYGWQVYHPPDNLPTRTARGRVVKQDVRPGFPDLTLVRPPELLFAELKTDSGRLSRDQIAWIAALEQCGQEVHVWRPQSFDELHERLARGRRRVEPVYRAGEAA